MWKPERARQLLDREGRTRKWIAPRCGLTVDSLSQCLGGHRSPGKAALILMAQLLRCDPNELDDEFEALQVG